MPRFLTPGLQISAIGAVVPSAQENLAGQLTLHGADRVNSARKALGIKTRHIAGTEQTTLQLMKTTLAALIINTKTLPRDIGLICCVSQISSSNPGHSFLLQKHFNIPSDCLCLDLSFGCSAITHALIICAPLIAGLHGKKAIILAGDTLSHFVAEDNPTVSLLFGDGAGGMMLEPATARETIYGSIKSKGQGAEHLCLTPEPTTNKPQLKMNGMQVFNFSISEIPLIIQETLAFAGVKPEEIDYYLLHQANEFMMNTIRKKLKIPKEKMPIEIASFGNTSGASIPLAICAHFAPEKLSMLSGKMLLCGFGIGLSWSCVITDFKNVKILPVIKI